MSRPKHEKPEFRLVKIEGRRNWYIRYSEPGSRRSRVKSTGIAVTDRLSADIWLESFKAETEAPSPTATVAKYIDVYLADRKNARTIGRMISFAKPVKSYFGNRTPDQITKNLVAGYLAHRKGMVTTTRRELELLRQSLNYSEVSPGTQIILPAPKPPREHFATKKQAELLLQFSKDHLRLFMLIAMATGARKGAILDLTWDRVDLDRQIVDFNNPNIQISKKRRAVTPISTELNTALRDQSERTVSNNVIEYGGKPMADIRKSFATAVDDAKLPEWITPHVLKHSVITWLAEDGWTVDQISDFTNTARETVARVYRKVNPDSLRGMADSLSFGALVPTPLALTNNDKNI